MKNTEYLPINEIKEFRFEVDEPDPEHRPFADMRCVYRLSAALDWCRNNKKHKRIVP